MDILTDILNTAGLKKRILNQRSLYEPWSLTFPCPHSIGFHVVLQGTAYIWQPDETSPIILHKGDIAFMSRGMHHFITTHNDKTLINTFELKPVLPQSKKGDESILTLVSGAYQLWHDPIHPLFKDLPDWKIIRADSITYIDSLQNCLQILSNELKDNNLGSKSIVTSLLDVMFNLIIRKIITNNESGNWSYALNDPLILQSLQLMHSEPDKEWTVETLAQSIGLSRSGFALKFKQVLGESPLNYLTTLRIFKATDLLNNTDYNLEKVAHFVGYKDAFSFSKTFKRLTGMSPKSYRQKNEDDKKLAWRF